MPLACTLQHGWKLIVVQGVNMVASNESTTQLLIQPGSGTKALLEGIDKARERIHIVIFRFDRREIEMALKRAARRGVFVHALVAHTSAGQGGEITLRKLEMRLLADGITVTRTASDLVRYHDKLMIIDQELLYLLGFNFTYLDIDRSRSFAIITRKKEWIDEAEKLFMADATRQQYSPECDTFVVSPGNSRKQLTGLLASARKQLLIYDDKLSDPDMMRLLTLKVRSGVDVRVIGLAGKRALGVKTGQLFMRLHAQVIIRDGEQMFLGSQSLRSVELDARRETGLILDDPDVIDAVISTFEADWTKIHSDRAPIYEALEEAALGDEEEDAIAAALIPHVPRDVATELVKAAVKEAIKDAILENVEPGAAGLPLKEAIKEAAREALHDLAQ
jgi:cardiolipin synthase